jgi:Na+-driven multidrug efflux pump
MLKELIPLICIGTLFETIGSISFALLGAQGSFGLATSMYFIGSWLVTLPLALIFALVGFNLQGLACAVVVGSVLSGVANTFLLLDSDWYYFADTVRQQNKAEMGH